MPHPPVSPSGLLLADSRLEERKVKGKRAGGGGRGKRIKKGNKMRSRRGKKEDEGEREGGGREERFLHLHRNRGRWTTWETS